MDCETHHAAVDAIANAAINACRRLLAAIDTPYYENVRGTTSAVVRAFWNTGVYGETAPLSDATAALLAAGQNRADNIADVIAVIADYDATYGALRRGEIKNALLAYDAANATEQL